MAPAQWPLPLSPLPLPVAISATSLSLLTVPWERPHRSAVSTFSLFSWPRGNFSTDQEDYSPFGTLLCQHIFSWGFHEPKTERPAFSPAVCLPQRQWSLSLFDLGRRKRRECKERSTVLMFPNITSPIPLEIQIQDFKQLQFRWNLGYVRDLKYRNKNPDAKWYCKGHWFYNGFILDICLQVTSLRWKFLDK